MPARHKKVEQPATPPAPTSAVPEYVRESRIYQRRKVTKRRLPSFEEAMFLLHVPEMSRLYFEAIFEGLKVRDKAALEHAGEMLTYVQRKGFSINIAQQLLQQNTAAGAASPVTGFDALVRQLAAARGDNGNALPEPAATIDVRPADFATEFAIEAGSSGSL